MPNARILIFLSVSFLTVGSLRADSLPVVNYSFEQSSGYAGGVNSTVPGWVPPPGGGAYGAVANVTSYFTSGLSGTNAISVGGQITQQISANFQNGQIYRFTADVGNPNNVGNDGSGVSFGFRNTANSGFISGASLFVGSQYSPDGTFQTYSFSYTATAADDGNPIIIGLNDYYSGNSTNSGYYLDDVTVSVVPEPSTYLGGVLCLSALALGSRGLKKITSILR